MPPGHLHPPLLFNETFGLLSWWMDDVSIFSFSIWELWFNFINFIVSVIDTEHGRGADKTDVIYLEEKE